MSNANKNPSDAEKNLSNHLALAVTILESICEQVGLDTEDTKMNVSIDGSEVAKVPLSKMIETWKALTGPL